MKTNRILTYLLITISIIIFGLFSFNSSIKKDVARKTDMSISSNAINANRISYVTNDDGTATIVNIDLGINPNLTNTVSAANSSIGSANVAVGSIYQQGENRYSFNFNFDQQYKQIYTRNMVNSPIKDMEANLYGDGTIKYANKIVEIPSEIDGHIVTKLASVYDLISSGYEGNINTFVRYYTKEATQTQTTIVKAVADSGYGKNEGRNDAKYTGNFTNSIVCLNKSYISAKRFDIPISTYISHVSEKCNIFSISNDLRAYNPENFINNISKPSDIKKDVVEDSTLHYYYLLADTVYTFPDNNNAYQDANDTPKYTTYNETNKEVTTPSDIVTDIIIPSTITDISDNAFNGLSNITTLSGDGNYSKEVQSAFKNLTALQSATLNNTEIIYANVFQNITTLQFVSFTSVTQIGEAAFSGCSSLLSISVPNVTIINESTFNGCSSLTDATFGKLINVYDNAFNGCSSLKTDLDTSGLTILGNQAFNGCSSLTTLSLDNITTINKDDISGCVSLTALNLSKVKEIPVGLFSGMVNLVNLNIATATSLYDSAFLNFTKLSTVDISSITYLPVSVFKGCVSLSNIKLNSIKSLGDEAFFGCSSLASIKNIDRITSVGLKVFYGCSSLIDLNLPFITEVAEDLITGCTSLSILSLDNVKEVPITFFNGLTNLTELNINSLNTIYNSQFLNFNKLVKVSANGVSVINENAFSGCSSLKDVDLNNVITVKENAFSNCKELLSLNLPTVLKIGDNAFLNCTKLDNITINNVETLNTAVFDGCSSLTKLYANNLKTIGTYAFRNCISLTTLELPNVTTIATGVFDGCTNLKYTYLYQTLVAIADNVLTSGLKNMFVFDNKDIYTQSLLVANMEKYEQNTTYKVRVSYINTNNLKNSIFIDAFNSNLNNLTYETTDTGITYYTYIAGNELIIPTIDDVNNITIDEKNIVNYKIYTLKENDVYSEIIDSNNSTSNNYISNKILQKGIVSDKLDLYVCLAINFDEAIKANLLDTLFIQNVSTTNDNQDITNVSFKDLNSTYKFEFKLKNEALSLPVEGYTYTYEWSNNTETNINNNSIEFNDILMFKNTYNVKLNIVSNDGTFNYTISSNDYSFMYTIGQISVEILDQVRYTQGITNEYGKDYKVYIDGILLTQEQMDLYFNSGYGLELNGDEITFNGTVKDEYKDVFSSDIKVTIAKVNYKKTIIILIISGIGVVMFGIALYLTIKVPKRRRI